jgi:hypothetical protein
LAGCGDSTWGDIPTDDATLFVDGSYAGADGDGTQSRPFTTIGEAVLHAPTDALIAVAAGSYAEDVRVDDRSLRIAGRCPDLVRVTGTGFEAATISVIGAAGVELRGLSVDGPRAGIWLRDAPESVVEQVRVASPGHVGLVVRGPTSSTTVREVLIESAVGSGILVFGARADVESTCLRDTAPAAQVGQGFGVTVQPDAGDATRGQLGLRRSVIEGSRGAGVAILGSDAQVEATVIRDTRASEPSDTGGQGIQVVFDPASGQRASLQLQGSVVERSRSLGMHVAGADAEVQASVIRDTGWQAPELGRFWAAAWLEHPDSGERSSGALRSSLLERSTDAGLLVSGADLEVDSSWIRDTRIGQHGWGRGIEAAGTEMGPDRTHLQIRSSRVEESQGLGVFAAGASLELEATLVRDTMLGEEGVWGYGVLVQDQPHTGERGAGTVRFAAVESNVNCGILVSSADLTVESTLVRNTKVGRAGDAGYGIEAQRSTYSDGTTGDEAHLMVQNSLVQDSAAVALAVFGSRADVVDTDLVRSSTTALGLLGDGVVLVTQHAARSNATLTRVSVLEMQRAGIANFGGEVQMEQVLLDCNPIPLNGETQDGFAPAFEDRGGNVCRCEEAAMECAVRSSGLQAPDPVH